jgi:hypothetical protein
MTTEKETMKLNVLRYFPQDSNGVYERMLKEGVSND